MPSTQNTTKKPTFLRCAFRSDSKRKEEIQCFHLHGYSFLVNFRCFEWNFTLWARFEWLLKAIKLHWSKLQGISRQLCTVLQCPKRHLAEDCASNLHFGAVHKTFDSFKVVKKLRGGCQLCKYQIETPYRADFLREPSLHYSKHFDVSNF